MIKAQDLRLPAIIETGSEIDNCEIDQYKGIPLTEEWLLRAGFTNENIRKNPRNSHWINGHISLWCDNKQNYAFFPPRGSVFIKYVHQLQNLCYALGTELTFKP